MSVTHWIGASSARLSFAALGALGVVVGAGIPAARYVHHHSTSPSVDLLIVTGLMFLVLGAAVLQALLLGELVFRKKWRERFLLGQSDTQHITVESIQSGIGLDAVVRPPSRTDMLVFSLVVLGCVVFDVTVLDRATAGFVTEYPRFGYYRTALRGATGEERAKLLLEIADRPTDDVALYTEAVIVPELDSADAERRAHALDALWWTARRMTTSVDLLNEARARTDRWEYAFAKFLRESIAPRVRVQITRATDADEQVAAARFIGEIRDPDSVDALSAWAKSQTEPNADTIRVRRESIVALGESGQLGAIEFLTEQLSRDDDDLTSRELTVWALGQAIGIVQPSDAALPESIRGREYVAPAALEEGAKVIIDQLTSWPPSLQCVGLGVLFRVQDARASQVLMALFDSEKSTHTCPDIEWPRPKGPPIVLSEREDVKMWTLRALATIAIGDIDVLEWLTLAKQKKDRFSPDLIRELENLHYVVGQSLE